MAIRKDRNYREEAKTAATPKKKKYRAKLRRERVARGLTGKDGRAIPGKGKIHVLHDKKGKIKGTGPADANFRDQPKSKKRKA